MLILWLGMKCCVVYQVDKGNVLPQVVIQIVPVSYSNSVSTFYIHILHTLFTGEMLVGPTNALFMDEISSGLDSSTTVQIIKCLRQIVHILDGTAVISLLQPEPETYELFDDIILLSNGQIVYQGPREFVLEFFESMGFRCPERKAVADFLQEVNRSFPFLISYKL